MYKEVKTSERSGEIVYRAKDLPPALLPFLVPFAILEEESVSIPSRIKASRISSVHQRSVVIDTNPWDAIEYQEQVYEGLSAKGSHEGKSIAVEWNGRNFHINGMICLSPEVLDNRTTGLEKALGPQEGQKQNLYTEVIVLVYKPDLIEYEGELIPQDELKQRLIDKVEQTEPVEKTKTWVIANNTQAGEVRAYLEGKNFYQFFRLQPMAVRNSDLTSSGFLEEMAKVFRFINIRELHKSRRDPSHLAQLWYMSNDYYKGDGKIHFEEDLNEMVGTYEDLRQDPEVQERVVRFFSEYAVRNYATELALLHARGSAHTNLHSGNVFPPGQIGDHDTLEPFDTARTDAFDIRWSIEIGIINWISKAEEAGYLSSEEQIVIRALYNFLDTYLKTRYGEWWAFEKGVSLLSDTAIESSVLRFFGASTVNVLAQMLEESLYNKFPEAKYALSYDLSKSVAHVFFAEFLEIKKREIEKELSLLEINNDTSLIEGVVRKTLGKSYFMVGFIRDYIRYIEKNLRENVQIIENANLPTEVIDIYVRIVAYKFAKKAFDENERNMEQTVNETRLSFLSEDAI